MRMLIEFDYVSIDSGLAKSADDYLFLVSKLSCIFVGDPLQSRTPYHAALTSISWVA